MNGQNFHKDVEAKNLVNVVSTEGGVVNYNINEKDSQSRLRWRIPFTPNPAIVPRPDLTAQLDDLLPATSESYRSAALYGLGGSGKTQLALDYAHRLSNSRSVFWVHADTEATFVNDYKEVARTLDLATKNLSDDELLKAVRLGIEREPHWLLVIDNADNLDLFIGSPLEQNTDVPTMIEKRSSRSLQPPPVVAVGARSVNQPTSSSTPANNRTLTRSRDTISEAGNGVEPKKILRDYLPIGPNGSILWTTRDEGITRGLVDYKQGIQVAHMKKNEARQLLMKAACLKIGPEEGGEPVDDLLEELQWIPLAISQAGAYMRFVDVSISDYLGMLRKGQERWKTLSTSHFDAYRRNGVNNGTLEIWHITMEHLKQSKKVEEGLAYKILHIIVYLDSQNIPWEILRAAAVYEDDDQEEQSSINDTDIKRAVRRLKDFAFLSQRDLEGEQKSYEMHKLVHEGVRSRLHNMTMNAKTRVKTQNTRLETRQPGAGMMSTKPRLAINRKPPPPSSPALRSPSPATNAVLAMNPTEQSESYFVCAALRIIDDAYPEECEVQTWKQCEKYLAHAMRISEYADICSEPVRLGCLLMRVSTFLLERQRWREKEVIDKRAEALLRKELGGFHPDTHTSTRNLAITYHNQGRHAEAEELCLQVLSHQKKRLGELHIDTLKTKRILANVYWSQGRYSEAELLDTEVMDTRREVLGAEHPETLDGMHNLAVTYHDQGRHSEAEKLCSDTWHARKDVLGSMHPDTILSLRMLANIYIDQGRYNEAEKMHNQAWQQSRELLGEAHPHTLYSYAALASTYYMQDRYSEAEQIEKRVLEQRKRLLGEAHPDTLRAYAALASTHYMQDRYSEAEQIEKRVLEQRRLLLGEAHPETLDAYAALAGTYYMQGQYAEAEKIQKRVLEQRQRLLGEAHPDTLYTYAALASTYYMQDRYAEAEKMQTRVLEQRRFLLGNKHPDTLTAMYTLALTLKKSDATVGAICLLEECVAQSREVLGPEHPDTKASEETLDKWKASEDVSDREDVSGEDSYTTDEDGQ
ncbi:Kinesin light chain 3 [Paramyrothecium foliicola]|nr:Kinesin light chain 3 [Paramyrothecium foliicola]